MTTPKHADSHATRCLVRMYRGALTVFSLFHIVSGALSFMIVRHIEHEDKDRASWGEGGLEALNLYSEDHEALTLERG